ncbi:MAG: alpha/beta fold hydrolase [Zavarzinella sp.]
MADKAYTIHHYHCSDGYQCAFRHYPAPNAKTRLILLHGIQSHAGWYERSCTQLAARGIECYFLDRRGSGLNTDNRGDCPSFRRLLDDIAEFIKQLPQGGTTSLAAISWGGKLGVGFQYRHPGLVQKLALLCPGLFPKVGLSLMKRLWIGRCALRAPTKLFDIPLNDPNLFTTSETWREFIRNDSLALHQATARMLFQSNSLDIYLRRARKWLKLPVLLQLASEDQIIDNAQTRRYIERSPSNSKIIEYAGAHHTLEFEPENHPFVEDLATFLLQE